MKSFKCFLFLCFFLIATYAFAEGDGYGENPGGYGGDTVLVDNVRDLKSYAAASEPYVILIKDTIDVGSSVQVRSYKTISGINPKSTILGNINVSGGTHDVVIKNLNITNQAEDGITIRNAKYVYVNNCTIFDCADGCIDVTVESDFVTISNCRFYYQQVTFHKFVNLIGADDGNITDRGKLHVTMHGNWWDTGCTSRMPRVRFGYVHLYNNYNNASGNNYASRSGLEGHIFSEYNYFDGVRDPLTTEGGWATSQGNKYVNCEGTIHPGNDVTFTPSYTYATINADDAKESVVPNAGNTNQNPIVPQEKKSTIIHWENQDAIFLGTPLDETQLNATADGNTSSPIYSHPLGTELPEGYHTLTVTFPENEEYLSASKTVNIRVKYDFYTLTLNTINGAGNNLFSVSPEGTLINNILSYPIDTEVEITANNNIISTFENWQNGDTNPTKHVTINGNTEVTALYAPISYIAAWDLINPDGGNKDRTADFYEQDENRTSTLSLNSTNGTISWTSFNESNLLEGKAAAMIRRGSSLAGNYYFEIHVNASRYQNLKVEANMLGMLTYYQQQNVEFSVDGIQFTKIGAFNLEEDSTWYPGTFTLPSEADKAENLTIRFKADLSSHLFNGSVIGTSISEIRVLADPVDNTAVEAVNTEKAVLNRRYFSVDGREQKYPTRGLNIILIEFRDGTSAVKKEWHSNIR